MLYKKLQTWSSRRFLYFNFPFILTFLNLKIQKKGNEIYNFSELVKVTLTSSRVLYFVKEPVSNLNHRNIYILKIKNIQDKE